MLSNFFLFFDALIHFYSLCRFSVKDGTCRSLPDLRRRCAMEGMRESLYYVLLFKFRHKENFNFFFGNSFAYIFIRFWTFFFFQLFCIPLPPLTFFYFPCYFYNFFLSFLDTIFQCWSIFQFLDLFNFFSIF